MHLHPVVCIKNIDTVQQISSLSPPSVFTAEVPVGDAEERRGVNSAGIISGSRQSGSGVHYVPPADG